MYGALGVHPDDADGLTEADMDYIEQQAAQSSKIVAIGEIGLDYYYPADATYPKTGKDAQKYWFERQIELARQVKLPIMIHSREAAKDTEDILRQAMRYSLVRQLKWDNTPVDGKSGVVQFAPSATIEDYPEIDLFGYMKTTSKEDGKGEKGGA